jgi:ABC-type dipeptide/oligopeptide/nickel transport system permease subunit
VRRLPVAAWIGLAVLLLLVVAAVFAPWIAPHSATAGSLEQTLLPPAWMHGGNPSYPLGTDALGRDELSRLIYGCRVSLIVGFAAAGIAAVVGIPLGILAGYLGGAVDWSVSLLLNVLLGFPFILLAVMAALTLGSGLGNVILVLGITGWPLYTRVMRTQVLELRERDFVRMARTLGYSKTRVMVRHILPSVVPTFLVVSSLQVGHMILGEAFLSFIGLGVRPPQPSWGGMLSDGTQLIFTNWWLTVFPGVLIFVTVLSFNLIADGLRAEERIGRSVQKEVLAAETA